MRVNLAGLVIALSFAGMTPSQATIVPVTYTGTVSFVSDVLDIFGSPADGQSFTLKYVFDTSLGPNFKNLGPELNDIQGGTNTGDVSPSLGAVLTIGAKSFVFGGSFYAQIFGSNDGTSSGQTHIAADSDLTSVTTLVQSSTIAIPSSITGFFKYIVDPNTDSAFGFFQIFDQDSNGTTGNLNIETLTVGTLSETPLPGALPLFATGLGAMGLLGWRRQRKIRAPLTV